MSAVVTSIRPEAPPEPALPSLAALARRDSPKGAATDSPWMQLSSGAAFDLVGQEPAQIDIRDIAVSLAKICRYNGHTARHIFYSVAQHSVLVSNIMHKATPEAQLYALLHDAHEAYVGDMIRPVKQLFEGFDVYDARADVENVIQRSVHMAVGLPHPVPAHIAKAIKTADEILLATERRDIMAEPARPWRSLPDPVGQVIRPWPWSWAEEKFMVRYSDLRIACGMSAETSQ